MVDVVVVEEAVVVDVVAVVGVVVGVVVEVAEKLGKLHQNLLQIFLYHY